MDGSGERSPEDEEFARERAVLLFLRSLKHPHIIEILASYTYRFKDFILFPAAECNLAEALAKSGLSRFSDNELFGQLCGLSSAIAHVHNYCSTEYDIRLIGCHHDLKPKNVLLLGKKLLLADFGLSQLKDGSDSQSIFKQGDRQYLAPECETFNEDLTVCKNLIGRSSDIYALGAMLSEILTFLVKGSAAVSDFRGKRKKTLHETYVVCQFHHGGQRCPEVDRWLADLEESFDEYEAREDEGSKAALQLISNLIQDMLSIHPKLRPDAEEITLRFHHVELTALYSACSRSLHILAQSSTNLQFVIEQNRLVLWSKSASLDNTSRPPKWMEQLSKQQLQMASLLLSQLRHNLHSLEVVIDEVVVSPLYVQLRHLIDQLWALSPRANRDEMRIKLVTDLLCVDEKSLEAVIRLTEGPAGYQDIGTLAAMKFITLQMDQQVLGKDAALGLSLSGKDLSNRVDFGTHRLCAFQGHYKGAKPETVLVEDIKYDASWVKDSHGQELIDRTVAIANLLRTPTSFSGVRTLQCMGFLHRPDLASVALVFQMPKAPTQSSKPTNLRDFVITTLQKKQLRPLLGDVFFLAHSLAKCLLDYHTIRWLHKSISSYNIIFFPEDSSNESLLSAFKNPYLIGFSHSRQSGEKVFTRCFFILLVDLRYLHPQYISERCARFNECYDYYSLGMVLLELGVWHLISDWTLSDKWRRLMLDPYQTRDKILEDIVPKLGSATGKVYMDVVTTCLKADQLLAGDNFEASARSVQTLVITPLSTLLAV